jgi:hypothetical protein
MREILEFAWRLHSETSVSCTRNAHFQKTALSSERLVYARRTFSKSSVVSSTRYATFFEKKCCLVYAKPPLWEATLSRAHPSPALLSQLEHGKSRVSSTRNACLQKAPKTSRLSSTRNAHFQMQVSSRLRETQLFLTIVRLVYAKHPLWEAKAEPSRAQPSPAQLSRADPSRAKIQTQNKVASRLREMLFFS